MTDPTKDGDKFALTLLEESKRFLEKAKDSTDAGKDAYLHAALLLAFCSLEAHINSMAFDFAEHIPLTPHELGLLREKKVRLENGNFQVTESLDMIRLEDKVRFICVKFARNEVDFTNWWSRLAQATKLRNELTHPKKYVPLEIDAVSLAIEAIVDALNAIYLGVFAKPFPAAGSRLDSEMTF